MAAKEFKIERSVKDEDLPAYLRQLADWLEGDCEEGEPACALGIDAGGFRKFKLGLKRRRKTLSLKLTVKGDAAPAPSSSQSGKALASESTQKTAPASGNNGPETQIRAEPKAPAKKAASAKSKAAARKRRPAYKPLKKRLKGQFKTIQDALRLNSQPPEDAVSAFLSDSRLMTSFPGKGDEFYPEYDAACDALQNALADGDLKRATEAVNTLAECKKRCHEAYK